MAEQLVPVMKQVQKVGGDVGKHKRRRRSQRTFIDTHGQVISKILCNICCPTRGRNALDGVCTVEQA